ncbi:MAG: prepilin-type N-terminal cleavage/methylation domain-containing protein [bacterium]|nr:MAG: prepilin-type N-terminal cleavage/methylation domain-containing protein [bacterium]
MGRSASGLPKGFTLVEIMAAVTILALMAAVTFTIVFGAVKRSRYIDRELELQTEAASIGGLMAEDIRGAFHREGLAPFFLGRDSFNRDDPADAVTLVTTSVLPVRPDVPIGSAGEVEYIVTEREDGVLVLLRREQSPPVDPPEEGGAVYEVTDRVRSLNLTYSDGEDWFDRWDSQGLADHEAGKLPRKVRIELVLEEDGQRVTYSSTVAPVMAVGR